MDTLEIKKEGIRGVMLTSANERIFSIQISLNIHDKFKSVQKDILERAYTYALMAGCGAYSREAFLDALNMLGASLSISVSNGILTIKLRALIVHHLKALTLLQTMITKPAFANTEIKRIIELIGNELHEEEENAKVRSEDELVNVLYKESDSRYSYSPAKLKSELPTVTSAKIKRAHKDIFSRHWTFTIVASPEVAKSTVSKLLRLRKSFGQIEPESSMHASQTITKKTVVLTPIPSKQNIEINIGAPLPLTTNEREYFAFLFGMYVLGKWGGFAGRLMSTVREKEGLTYGIYARVESATKQENGYWRIMTFFAPDKVLQGINSTFREIDLIQKKGITESEYERFKNILESGYVLVHDSILAQASEVHSFQINGYTVGEIEAFKKNLLSVTREEINAALKKYLTVEKIVISAAGPVSGKAKELRAL